jgi:hypothetical protein
VLAGRLPVNFFQVNPFVASSRAVVGDGRSAYHGLEIELRRRFARGLAVQANYSYGKALADYDGDANELLNDVRPSSVRFPQYSRQEIMPRQQFNANWVYELPFGPGKHWLARGLAARALGGWQLTGLLNVRSGRPLGVTSGVGTFHRNGISAENTVDLSQNVSAAQIRDLAGVRNIGAGVFFFDPCLSEFLNAACTDSRATAGLFTLPEPGRLGQLGQTILFGPGRFIVDMGLIKQTRLRERATMEVRWEVFNALNKANFNVPLTDVLSANFGQITRTVTNARLMQFALKVNF